jgi:hypothetical protein
MAYTPAVMEANAKVDSDRLALVQHELAPLLEVLGSETITPVAALHQFPAYELHDALEVVLVEAGHAA